MAIGTIGSISIDRGARKSLSFDVKLGAAKRFYKSDIRKMNKAIMSLPEVLHKSFEKAVGKKRFVQGVKATFARTATSEAGQVPLAEATIKIREYLATRGYPAVPGNQVMVHTGRMLTEGITVGATGKDKNFTLWVGFSAAKKSRTISETPMSGISYAEIADGIERGFSFPSDDSSNGESAEELFKAAGMSYDSKKHGGVVTVVARPFIDATARATLQYINDYGLKETEKQIPSVANEVIPF